MNGAERDSNHPKTNYLPIEWAFIVLTLCLMATAIGGHALIGTECREAAKRDSDLRLRHIRNLLVAAETAERGADRDDRLEAVRAAVGVNSLELVDAAGERRAIAKAPADDDAGSCEVRRAARICVTKSGSEVLIAEFCHDHVQVLNIGEEFLLVTTGQPVYFSSQIIEFGLPSGEFLFDAFAIIIYVHVRLLLHITLREISVHEVGYAVCSMGFLLMMFMG